MTENQTASAGPIVVPMAQTYTHGSAPFAEVRFRRPVYGDYRKLGAPYDAQRGLVIRDRDVIFAYADALLVDLNPGALMVLSLADAMAVEDAIFGFFTDARRALSKRENSSSGSAGTPATSTD